MYKRHKKAAYTNRYSQLKIESNNMLVYMPLTKQLKVYRYYD